MTDKMIIEIDCDNGTIEAISENDWHDVDFSQPIKEKKSQMITALIWPELKRLMSLSKEELLEAELKGLEDLVFRVERIT